MKRLHVYKYQGAGNDFVILDNRRGDIVLSPRQVNRLCDRRFGVGADGLMTLCASDRADFEMHYYNADGPEGTMCGNGGRCLVAFAALMGLKRFEFLACDGPHRADLLEYTDNRSIVRLKMRDVDGIDKLPDGWLLETGSTHFVQWVKGLESFDVDTEGKRLRWDRPSRHPDLRTRRGSRDLGLRHRCDGRGHRFLVPRRNLLSTPGRRTHPLRPPGPWRPPGRRFHPAGRRRLPRRLPDRPGHEGLRDRHRPGPAYRLTHASCSN